MLFDQNPIWNQKMNKEEVRMIARKLSEHGKMRFREAATEEEILRFENENGIKLPEKFKEWLLFSDGGEFFLPGGPYFRGVAHKPLIDVNDQDRPDEHFIVIGALSTGEPIVFEQGKEEISIYDHEVGRIQEEERFSDTLTFLNSLAGYFGAGD